MNERYVVFKCLTCGKRTMLKEIEVNHSEEASKYFTCGHDGWHRDLIVVGVLTIDKYAGIKECMQHDSFKRVNGRVQSR